METKNNQFHFKLLHQDKKTGARLGEIHTPHGVIHTPAFVPVGTQATVKSLTPVELEQLGVELFFVNTYHMAMRPGVGLVEKAGGLHRFMHWNRPLITDSGGFQVFSLARNKTKNAKLKTKNFEDKDEEVNLVKISENGVEFRSHWDGAKHLFTPEVSMQLQWQLGSDIHIAFDDCTSYPVTHEVAEKSMERTHRWEMRSLEENSKLRTKNLKLGKKYQALYGVVQGSIFEDLRKKSADFIAQQDFDGIAIGGVSVGESKKEMKMVCDWVFPRLPENKPRHLLGVGEIDDIFTLIEAGADTFDCVQPTRIARMGYAYRLNLKTQITNPKQFVIDINNKNYSEDFSPIDESCTCYTCQNFTKAYLHHLFRVHELLVYRLLTLHNLHFVLSLVSEIKRQLELGTYTAFKKTVLDCK